MRTNELASRTKIKFKLLGTRVNIFSKKNGGGSRLAGMEAQHMAKFRLIFKKIMYFMLLARYIA
jgi:hypothetical protein